MGVSWPDLRDAEPRREERGGVGRVEADSFVDRVVEAGGIGDWERRFWTGRGEVVEVDDPLGARRRRDAGGAVGCHSGLAVRGSLRTHCLKRMVIGPRKRGEIVGTGGGVGGSRCLR